MRKGCLAALICASPLLFFVAIYAFDKGCLICLYPQDDPTGRLQPIVNWITGISAVLGLGGLFWWLKRTSR